MSDLREMFEMTTKQIEPDLEAWQDQQRRQRSRATKRKNGALMIAAAMTIVGAVIVFQVVRTAGTNLRLAGEPHGTTITPRSVAHAWVEPFPTALAVSGGHVYARLDWRQHVLGFEPIQDAGGTVTPFCGGAGGQGGPVSAGVGPFKTAPHCAPVAGFSASHSQRVVVDGNLVVATPQQRTVNAFAPIRASASRCGPRPASAAGTRSR
jgi:hypothetical protein